MKKFWASGGIEDTYVRGAYDSNVVKVQVLSRPPFSKLMEFQSEIDSHGKLELVSTSSFIYILLMKFLELKVAHVVAFYVIRCVSKKNNPHTHSLI